MPSDPEKRWATIWRLRNAMSDAHRRLLWALQEAFTAETEVVLRANDRRLDVPALIYRIPVGPFVFDFGLPHLRIAIQYEPMTPRKPRDLCVVEDLGWRTIVLKPESVVFRLRLEDYLHDRIRDALHEFDASDKRWLLPMTRAIRLCACGCGEDAPYGRRYVYLHHTRRQATPVPQRCGCGCGEWTRRGAKFRRGHHVRVMTRVG